ncbi:MAG TPA: hypothetical protein VLA88_04905 [Candidatus Saccharimonadales bacterium]|nr:hypothetical protein [Candidatus Saccharimonadales bacterium]
MDDLGLSDDELREFRAVCTFVTRILGDEPTEHDLAIARGHIPACAKCSARYAEFYRRPPHAASNSA